METLNAILAALTDLRSATERSQRQAEAAQQDAAEVKLALVEMIAKDMVRHMDTKRGGGSASAPPLSPALLSLSKSHQLPSSLSSFNPLSSSSSVVAGKAAPGRLAQMEGTVLKENSGLLRMAREQAESIRKLHDNTVPPDPSFPSSSFSLGEPANARHSSGSGSGSGENGGGGGGGTRTDNQQPSKIRLLDFVGDDMRHHRRSDGPQTGLLLLSNFFEQQARGGLHQKKIKSMSEWMNGMVKAQQEALTAGNVQVALQTVKYIELMVDINTKYGWAACEQYWFDLQKEADRDRHSFERDDPWNARCWAAMIEKHPLLAGRPGSKATASTSTTGTPAATPKKKKEGTSSKFYCSHHGSNPTHASADCYYLSRKPGSSSSSSSGSALSSSGGGAK